MKLSDIPFGGDIQIIIINHDDKEITSYRIDTDNVDRSLSLFEKIIDAVTDSLETNPDKKN